MRSLSIRMGYFPGNQLSAANGESWNQLYREFFWKVSVSVSPAELEEKPWKAFKVSFGKESSTEISYKTLSMDYSCKGQYGNGLYSKLWQFIPGEFYDRAEAFVYETSEGCGGLMLRRQ